MKNNLYLCTRKTIRNDIVFNLFIIFVKIY
jgi:hypothetical protein